MEIKVNMTKHVHYIALMIMAFSMPASSNPKCSSTNMQWFYETFEPLGITQELIDACLTQALSGVHNFEGELAANGECIAEIITNRKNGSAVADAYNNLMEACGQSQLFIAQVSNIYSRPDGKSSCYLHVMNNLPSAGISPACIEKLKTNERLRGR